jgi:hypothetical protein
MAHIRRLPVVWDFARHCVAVIYTPGYNAIRDDGREISDTNVMTSSRGR